MSTTPQTSRDALLAILAARSFQYDASAPFKLSSGRFSEFYVDCKPTTMSSDGMELVGETILECVPEDAQAIGGLTIGADPIASATALVARLKYGRNLDTFVVRKQPKEHGLRKRIEGCAASGTRVVVVDDVVTSGSSTVEAIERCEESGLKLVAVVVLVDRQEEGGLRRIQEAAGPGVPVRAIFARTDLQDYAAAHGHKAAAGPRAAAG